MHRIRSFATISARILIALIFLLNGVGIIDQSFAIHEMIARGIPAYVASALSMSGRVIEIFAGAGLIFGIYPELCVLALIAFMIPATLIAHSFWLESGNLFQLQLVNFLKNVAIVGGLLFVASASSNTRNAKAELIGR